MSLALPNYRERLGGAIHPSTPYKEHVMKSRLNRIFPKGYIAPSRIGHIAVVLTDEQQPKAFPFLHKFEYIDGVAQNVDDSHHATLCEESKTCGFDRKVQLLTGYLWENRRSGLLPYTVALISYVSINEPQLSAVATLTEGGGLLNDHDVFIGYEQATGHKTFHCREGSYSEYFSGKMPDEMQLAMREHAKLRRGHQPL